MSDNFLNLRAEISLVNEKILIRLSHLFIPVDVITRKIQPENYPN